MTPRETEFLELLKEENRQRDEALRSAFLELADKLDQTASKVDRFADSINGKIEDHEERIEELEATSGFPLA